MPLTIRRIQLHRYDRAKLEHIEHSRTAPRRVVDRRNEQPTPFQWTASADTRSDVPSHALDVKADSASDH